MKNTPVLNQILMSLCFLSVAACGPKFSDAVLPDDPTSETPYTAESEDSASEASESEPAAADLASQEAVLAKYSYIDSTKIVPTKHLKAAVLYYEANKSKIKNTQYLSVLDYGQHSSKKRFYIINMQTGAVWNIRVAHGKGSDANHDGYLEKFSNVSGSNATSQGFMKTAETYSGSHGLSLRLDGLAATNSRARSRAIVIHGAAYVQEANVTQGRSWGCPAVAMENRTKLINMIKGGSIIYAAK